MGFCTKDLLLWDAGDICADTGNEYEFAACPLFSEYEEDNEIEPELINEWEG